MSVQAIQWATKVRGISGQEKAVLFVLADAHNGKTGKCFPSQVVIADGAGMTDRSVRKFVSLLEQKGFIGRTVSSYGRGLVTFYELHFQTTEPNGSIVPVGHTPPTGNVVPLAPPPPTGRIVPLGQGDQPENPRRPTGNCVPVAIEEPEKEPEYPSSDANASSEGRSPDLFEDQPPPPPAISKREMATDIVFRIGKPLLSRDGLTPKEAGAFLGKLIKNSNLEIVAKVVSQAALAPPVDARQWLTAAANAEARKAGIPSRTIRKSGPPNWPAIIARWFEDGSWPRSAGPPPTERDFAGPINELEAILPKFETGHPTARDIRRVIDARQRA